MSKKREHERALFQAFIDTTPDFAGEPLAAWVQPEQENDFPDIAAKTISGRPIGIELGEWINQEEMQAAKAKERREYEFLEVIGDQGSNPTEHIQFVWLHPKANARIAPGERAGFRDQLFAFVAECDERWPRERFWKIGYHATNDDLSTYPLLAKHLDAIRLWPVEGKDQFEKNWITFPMRGGFFDHQTMQAPLLKLLTDKVSHYGSGKAGFDLLTLILIYNQAAIYNSPAETPLHSYEDAVEELRRVITDPTPFDQVLLYIALVPGRVSKVF